MATDAKVSLEAVKDKLALCAGLDLDDRRDGSRARAMLREAEDVLGDCVGLRLTVTGGPERSDQMRRLRVMLGAHRDFLRAISGLDSWTWNALIGEINMDKCALPTGPHDDFSPASPPAIEELGRAAVALETKLKTQRSETRDEGAEYRDQAIAELAGVFHHHATAMSRAEYRTALVGMKNVNGFIPIALTAAGFVVPEHRKIWQRIPEEFRTER